MNALSLEQWLTLIAVLWIAASIVAGAVWHLFKVGSRKIGRREVCGDERCPKCPPRLLTINGSERGLS